MGGQLRATKVGGNLTCQAETNVVVLQQRFKNAALVRRASIIPGKYILRDPLIDTILIIVSLIAL